MWDTRFHPLTPRQAEVMKLLAQAYTYAEIAEEIGITRRTVKAHVQGTARALGYRNGLKGRVRIPMLKYFASKPSADQGLGMAVWKTLSTREKHVAELVVANLSNEQIGQNMGTTEQVIKNHTRKIYEKLGVWSRVELAFWYGNLFGFEKEFEEQQGDIYGS